MECPRCECSLVRYTLGGREAVVCESCGFIGVPVEHRGDRRDVESWGEALSRVDESVRSRGMTVESATGDPTESFLRDDGSDTEAGPTVVKIADDISIPGPEGEQSGDADEQSDSDVACDRCGKIFETQSQLNGHLAVHSK